MSVNGYVWDDVSRLSRVPASTLRTQDSRRWDSRMVRAAVEDGLGVNIFTTAREYRQRQEQKALLGGLCPVRATRAELRALARRLGLVGATNLPNRRTLIDQLCARARAVNLTQPKS